MSNENREISFQPKVKQETTLNLLEECGVPFIRKKKQTKETEYEETVYKVGGKAIRLVPQEKPPEPDHVLLRKERPPKVWKEDEEEEESSEEEEEGKEDQTQQLITRKWKRPLKLTGTIRPPPLSAKFQRARRPLKVTNIGKGMFRILQDKEPFLEEQKELKKKKLPPKHIHIGMTPGSLLPAIRKSVLQLRKEMRPLRQTRIDGKDRHTRLEQTIKRIRELTDDTQEKLPNVQELYEPPRYVQIGEQYFKLKPKLKFIKRSPGKKISPIWKPEKKETFREIYIDGKVYRITPKAGQVGGKLQAEVKVGPQAHIPYPKVYKIKKPGRTVEEKIRKRKAAEKKKDSSESFFDRNQMTNSDRRRQVELTEKRNKKYAKKLQHFPGLFRRLCSHKGVYGVTIVCNNCLVKSTLDYDSATALGFHWTNIFDKINTDLRNINIEDEIISFRMSTKFYEEVILPGKLNKDPSQTFMIIINQKVPTSEFPKYNLHGVEPGAKITLHEPPKFKYPKDALAEWQKLAWGEVRPPPPLPKEVQRMEKKMLLLEKKRQERTGRLQPDNLAEYFRRLSIMKKQDRKVKIEKETMLLKKRADKRIRKKVRHRERRLKKDMRPKKIKIPEAPHREQVKCPTVRVVNKYNMSLNRYKMVLELKEELEKLKRSERRIKALKKVRKAEMKEKELYKWSHPTQWIQEQLRLEKEAKKTAKKKEVEEESSESEEEYPEDEEQN